MQDHGIYVPDQDASWEREPHAFEELLFRYQHCDAPRCSCPLGRSHHQEDGRWKMVVCDSCGSQGVHASCGNVGGSHWICTECRQIINRVQPSSRPAVALKSTRHSSPKLSRSTATTRTKRLGHSVTRSARRPVTRSA
uniref:PHD finger protein n=1 Tax=Rhipicephalus zambeziensis TaxID=60191 RepID=A0A224YVN5_9ACAR